VYALGKYRHIIWDWNGTLLDDARTCVEVLNELLRRRGRGPVTYQEYRRDFDFPVKDYYIRLGFDFTVESYEALAYEYIDAYHDRQFECSLHDGAVDTLQSCKDLGLTQSILSAYQQDLLEEITQYFRIKDFFLKIAGLNDRYAHSKIDIGRQLLAELGFNGRQVLLIGDTLHDYEVAKVITADCILIANGHQRRQKLQDCDAMVLNSLAQIPAIVRR